MLSLAMHVYHHYFNYPLQVALPLLLGKNAPESMHLLKLPLGYHTLGPIASLTGIHLWYHPLWLQPWLPLTALWKKPELIFGFDYHQVLCESPRAPISSSVG